jgi:hypothetical protein
LLDSGWLFFPFSFSRKTLAFYPPAPEFFGAANLGIEIVVVANLSDGLFVSAR